MPVIGGTVGDALKAYKAVIGGGNGAGASGGGADAASEGNFGDMLKSMASDAMSSIQKGETATVQAVAGKADMANVVTAVSSAQMTLQTVVAIRDQVINAYKSIIAMAI